MCESSAYLLTDGEERLLLEHLDIVETLEEDRMRLVDIFGEEKILRIRVKRFSLLEHKILFEPLQTCP